MLGFFEVGFGGDDGELKPVGEFIMKSSLEREPLINLSTGKPSRLSLSRDKESLSLII